MKKVKVWLLKVWNWVKDNVMVVVAVFLGLIALSSFSKEDRKYKLDFLKKQREADEKKGIKISEAKEAEAKEKENNLKKYYETIDYINYEYSEKSKSLDDKKKKKIKEIVDKSKPEELKSLIDKEFNFKK